MGHARDFTAFLKFDEINLAKFVSPSSAQAYFRRLFVDFPAEHDGGFHRLLQALENGDNVNTSADGSKIVNDEALAG